MLGARLATDNISRTTSGRTGCRVKPRTLRREVIAWFTTRYGGAASSIEHFSL